MTKRQLVFRKKVSEINKNLRWLLKYGAGNLDASKEIVKLDPVLYDKVYGPHCSFFMSAITKDPNLKGVAALLAPTFARKAAEKKHVVLKTWDEVQEYLAMHLTPVAYGPKQQPIYSHTDIQKLNIKMPEDIAILMSYSGPCTTCGGTGTEPGSENFADAGNDCADCKGTGVE